MLGWFGVLPARQRALFIKQKAIKFYILRLVFTEGERECCFCCFFFFFLEPVPASVSRERERFLLFRLDLLVDDLLAFRAFLCERERERERFRERE
jgi:hypothetical protein